MPFASTAVSLWTRMSVALVFPTQEDIGVVPVEAQATGCPVIAFGRGGATETVLDGQTGLFFPAQSPDALTFRPHHFDPTTISQHALSFGPDRFKSEITAAVDAPSPPASARRRSIRAPFTSPSVTQSKVGYLLRRASLS